MSMFHPTRRKAVFQWAVALLFLCSSVIAQDQTSSIDLNTEDIDIRYARKRVELAKSDLEMATAQNERTPYVYSPLSMIRLKGQVSQAELLLANALRKEKTDPHAVHRQSVKLSVELAQQQLEWVSEASKSFPNMFQQDQVERFKYNLELAQLALERANDPTVTISPLDHLQWQIDQLQTEVFLLKIELELSKSGK